MGALLCEIAARLRRTGAPADEAFVLPLTQEEIGDATGLTAVHVNRMMRTLAEDGLIERQNGHVRLLDEQQLVTEVNYVDRTANETACLPRHVSVRRHGAAPGDQFRPHRRNDRRSTALEQARGERSFPSEST